MRWLMQMEDMRVSVYVTPISWELVLSALSLP